MGRSSGVRGKSIGSPFRNLAAFSSLLLLVLVLGFLGRDRGSREWGGRRLRQQKLKLRLEVGVQGAEGPSSHGSIYRIVGREALTDHGEALECFEKDLKILVRC